MSANSKPQGPVYLADLTRKQRRDIGVLHSIIRNKNAVVSPTSRPFPGTAAYTPLQTIFPLVAIGREHGNVGLSTESIDLSQKYHWFHRMTLVNNINIAFSNPPAGNLPNSTFLYTQFIDGWIEFIQDAVGGRTVTFPGSVISPPTINPAANSRTLVHWMTGDGGASYHVQVLGGSGGGWVGNATSDLDMNTFNIIDVDSLRFTVDNQITIPGNREFVPLVTGMRYNVPTGTEHQFSINGVAQLNIGLGNIDFQGNSLMDLNDILFTEPGQTILSSTSGLQLNIPTGDTYQFFINAALAMELSLNILDLNNRSIHNLNDILFTVAGQTILSDANGLTFNVPTGDEYEWLINGVLFAQLNSLGLLMSTTIDMNANSILDVGGIAMSDPNMIIDDTTNIFSVTVGATQQIQLKRGTRNLLSLGTVSELKSDAITRLTVTGSGDFIAFHDESSDRIFYDWDTDNFYPLDNIASLGKTGNRWTEVWALNGTIQTSFSEFKKDIKEQDCEDCLKVCEALKPIKFKWDKTKITDSKDESTKLDHFDKTEYFGFDADALKQVCPEAVAGPDGIYTSAVIANLLGAVINLSKRVKELEKS